MSSVGSVNSCLSPDVTSSNVSSNKLNDSNVNDVSGGLIRSLVPEVTKDNKYWERRRRNNEAARRSREKRRMNDMNMDNRIMELSQRNKLLEQELFQIKIGTVSSSQTAQYESQHKKSKLTPIIPSIETLKDKPTSSNVNEMVFPIFTTIKPVSSTPFVTETSKPLGLANPLKGNNPSITNDNIFPTNLLTFSNIPLLSSFIATPNFNDDVTTKPTLLLPPFQFPSKKVDRTNSADDFMLIHSNVSRSNSTSSYTKEEIVDSDDNGQNDLKIDLSGILDLRMKQENGEGFFNLMDNLPSLLGEKITAVQNVKEESNHIQNNNFYFIDESPDNSFLHMPELTNQSKDHFSRIKQSNQVPTKESHKARRRTKFSYGNKFRQLRRGRTMTPAIELQSRLQVRSEIGNIVRKENSKLHDAILCLSDDIKQLTSVLLSVVRSPAHVLPMMERSTCMSQEPPEDPC